jgi:ATP-dependent DNA ligase
MALLSWPSTVSGVHKAGGRVRLISRTGSDHPRRFAELAAAIPSLSTDTLILDGEVAIFDAQLVSRFEWLSPSGGHPTRAGGFRAMLERR